MQTLVHHTAYRFISLAQDQLPSLQAELKMQAKTLQIKGTFLLSTEGINFSLVGTQHALTHFREALQKSLPTLKGLNCQETPADCQPFKRLLVKIKKQIIAFPNTDSPITKKRAAFLNAEQLFARLQQKQEILLLDTRNHYEVAAGSFSHSIHLNLKHFRDFPQAIKQLPSEWKEKPIVSFCTGGIRCEKAALALTEQGFKEVYQLKGGILSYLKQYGNQHYQGGCYVFDERAIFDPTKINSSEHHEQSA